MKRTKKLLGCVLAVWMLCAACCALAEEAHGEAGTMYSMEVVLDETNPDKPNLKMKMEVTVRNISEDEWPEICFRDYMSSIYQWCSDNHEGEALNSGIVRAAREGVELNIRVEGVPLPSYPIDNQSAVFVELDKPLLPGESTKLELEYSADILDDSTRCAYSSLIYENEGARTYELAQFYPMLAVYENGEWNIGPYYTEGECVYSRCADYEIKLHVPEKYEVIASGDETMGETANGMTEWRISAKNMRDVTIIASNEYVCKTGEASGITVNSWYAPNLPDKKDDDHEKQGEIQLQAAMDAIDAFTAAYGALPYDELDVVESNYSFGGLEAPGLIRISQLYSWCMGENDPEADRKEYADRCAATVAHETAHEWFYAAVGNDQFHEAWLDESFAAFSEQVYWRHVGRSEEEIAAAMKPFVEQTPESGNTAINHAYHEKLDDGTDFDYMTAVYQRGAGFLYQLEQSMGQDTFYAFMREYYKAYCLREAHTEDFISALQPYIAENEAAQALMEKYLDAPRR